VSIPVVGLLKTMNTMAGRYKASVTDAYLFRKNFTGLFGTATGSPRPIFFGKRLALSALMVSVTGKNIY